MIRRALSSVGRLVVLLGIVLSEAACHRSAAPATAPATPSAPRAVPERVGQYALLAHEELSGGSGRIYRFRDTSKVNLSVILYDVTAEKEAANSTPAAQVRNEGEIFLAVLPIQVQRGAYDSFEVMAARPDSVISGHTMIPAFIVAATVRRRGVVEYDLQHLCLIGRTFVKVRATVPNGQLEQSNIAPFAVALIQAMAAP